MSQQYQYATCCLHMITLITALTYCLKLTLKLIKSKLHQTNVIAEMYFWNYPKPHLKHLKHIKWTIKKEAKQCSDCGIKNRSTNVECYARNKAKNTPHNQK